MYPQPSIEVDVSIHMSAQGNWKNIVPQLVPLRPVNSIWLGEWPYQWNLLVSVMWTILMQKISWGCSWHAELIYTPSNSMQSWLFCHSHFLPHMNIEGKPIHSSVKCDTLPRHCTAAASTESSFIELFRRRSLCSASVWFKAGVQLGLLTSEFSQVPFFLIYTSGTNFTGWWNTLEDVFPLHSVKSWTSFIFSDRLGYYIFYYFFFSPWKLTGIKHTGDSSDNNIVVKNGLSGYCWRRMNKTSFIVSFIRCKYYVWEAVTAGAICICREMKVYCIEIAFYCVI